MPDRPRVSFVVPAYNEERLLPACLDAIQAEIKRNGCTAEVIVVNNASTDRTREVALSSPAAAAGLLERVSGRAAALTGKDVARAAADGDVLAGELIAEVGH